MPFKKNAGFTLSELLLVIVCVGTLAISTLLFYRQALNSSHRSALGNDAPTVAGIAKEDLAKGKPMAPQAPLADSKAPARGPAKTSASLLAASEKSANAESSVSMISPATRAFGEALALFAALIVGLGWVARKVIKKAQRERASS